ncbi:MAG: DUF433 domain-containing protein [Blastocatellia bacterium]
MPARKRKELGEYIVADPEICHGQLTSKGTRVLVKDVLYMVAKGESWDWISDGYHGLPLEAIAEAVRLAGDALVEKAEKTHSGKSAEKRRRAA